MQDPLRIETLVGIFEDRSRAEQAVGALEEAGFGQDELGLLTPGGETDPRDELGKKVLGTTAAAGASGAVVGGIAGALAAGLIPGIGPVLAGGLLVPLIGASTAGATGGVAGMLFGASAAEDPRVNYAEYLKAGKTLVTVTGPRTEQARSVIAQHGGVFEEGAAPPPSGG